MASKKVDRRRETMRQIATASVAAGTPGKRYTPADIAAQMQFVGDAWVEGASVKEISRASREAYKAGTLGCALTAKRVGILLERVQRQLLTEAEDQRPYTKVRQARRITKALRECRGVRRSDGTWASKPDHASRARYEDMIARIEGNYEPIKVEVDAVHRQAVADIIAGLTDEEIKRYSDAFERLTELAESKARELGETLDAVLPRPPPHDSNGVRSTNGVNGTHGGSNGVS